MLTQFFFPQNLLLIIPSFYTNYLPFIIFFDFDRNFFDSLNSLLKIGIQYQWAMIFLVKLLNCNKLESTLDFFVSNHELSNWNQLYRDMLEAENMPQQLYRDKNQPLNYTQHITIRWKSQARCNTISHLCKCSKEFELSQHGLSTQSHDFNYFTLFEAGPKS